MAKVVDKWYLNVYKELLKLDYDKQLPKEPYKDIEMRLILSIKAYVPNEYAKVLICKYKYGMSNTDIVSKLKIPMYSVTDYAKRALHRIAYNNEYLMREKPNAIKFHNDIRMLKLSTRTHNGLARLHINTISELDSISEDKLLKASHLGPKAIKEIKENIKKYLNS